MITEEQKTELSRLLRTAADHIDSFEFAAAKAKIVVFLGKVSTLTKAAVADDPGELAAAIARRLFKKKG